MAFGDSVVPKLKGIAKAIYSQGRFVSVEDDHAVFAVENSPTRDRAERYRSEIESLLGSQLGVRVPLRLVVEDEIEASASTGPSGAPGHAGAGGSAGTDGPSGANAQGDGSSEEEAEIFAQVADLEDADVGTSTVDRLTAAFPGAELIEPEEGN